MNYYDARQVDPDSPREDAGLWRYTQMRDGHIWPVGYCAQDCPGHGSPDQAREHQRDYEVDEALRMGPRRFEPLGDCAVPDCKEQTDMAFMVGPGMGRMVNVCIFHCNRSGLEAAFSEVGMVMSS